MLDMKRYATVVTCSLGCHNQRRTSSDPSITHHKFISVSDTLWKAARDPVVLCTPEHHTVRVAHMFVTTARWRTINALERLQTLGCDVKIIMSATTASSQRAGIARMRQSGLHVGCTRFVHDKLILVDAVRLKTGPRTCRCGWAGRAWVATPCGPTTRRCSG